MNVDGNIIAARFIRETSWKGLPVEVRQKAKTCLLDNLGCMLAGSQARISRICRDYVDTVWPQGNEASIVMQGCKSSLLGAAFVNANTANATDMDDDGLYCDGHPGAQLVPATLALAEKYGLNGKELLSALVVGYEVAHRVGGCWHDYHQAFQACGAWGSVAIAAVASKVMGLDEDQIQHALGIAEYHAGNLPMMRDIDHPAMVKHGLGWAAVTGLMAAGLAAKGFTGIPCLLGFEKYRSWAESFGRDFIMVRGVSFKRYSSCLWVHPAIVACQKVISENKLALSQIAKIVVHGFHEMKRLGNRIPQTEEEAQFNVAWPLAVFLMYGEISPHHMLKENLSDQKLISLAEKISVTESEEMNQAHRQDIYPCRVEIFLHNECRLESGLVCYRHSGAGGGDKIYGDYVRHDDVAAKFMHITEPVVTRRTAQALLELVDNLDSLEDLTPFVTLWAGRQFETQQ